jgi:hypothetical protein
MLKRDKADADTEGQRAERSYSEADRADATARHRIVPSSVAYLPPDASDGSPRRRPSRPSCAPRASMITYHKSCCLVCPLFR